MHIQASPLAVHGDKNGVCAGFEQSAGDSGPFAPQDQAGFGREFKLQIIVGTLSDFDGDHDIAFRAKGFNGFAPFGKGAKRHPSMHAERGYADHGMGRHRRSPNHNQLPCSARRGDPKQAANIVCVVPVLQEKNEVYRRREALFKFALLCPEFSFFSNDLSRHRLEAYTADYTERS